MLVSTLLYLDLVALKRGESPVWARNLGRKTEEQFLKERTIERRVISARLHQFEDLKVVPPCRPHNLQGHMPQAVRIYPPQVA